MVFACLLGLVMGLAGAAPFFLLFRQFFLKMLCGAGGTGRAVSAFAAARGDGPVPGCLRLESAERPVHHRNGDLGGGSDFGHLFVLHEAQPDL